MKGSFTKFLTEASKDNTFMIAMSGVDSTSLDEPNYLTKVNATLARVTAEPFVTPYIALGCVSKVLAQAQVILPQNVFFQKEAGEMVFKITRNQAFGPDIHQNWGAQDQGSGWFVYFSFKMDDAGFFDVFAEVVSEAELEDLLDDDSFEDVEDAVGLDLDGDGERGEPMHHAAQALRNESTERDERRALVVAKDKSGQTHYYTGKAGPGWVSKERKHAWTGYNMTGAKNFADRHNKYSGLHGLTFHAHLDEETLDEARIPLQGHPYHHKSDAELHYIIKDAGEAAKNMQGHNPHAESKYLDQVNDASTILHHRKKTGTGPIPKPQVNEGLRLIATHTHGPHTAKVYRDNEWDEYRVKYHTNGKHLEKADSHHSDRDDAEGTAKHQIQHMKESLDEQQIVELSKGTLGSYVNKAVGSVRDHDTASAYHRERGKKTTGDTQAYHDDEHDRHDHKAQKRIDGIDKAVKKLSEDDELDESAPPGMEDMVKALKTKFPSNSSAPYAIAWARWHKEQTKADAAQVAAGTT